MRSLFPCQFRPNAEELDKLWNTCIFVVDANVLLNLYRYSVDTRQALQHALTSVQTRLFIPHQAAKEFLKHRLGVTAGQASEYATAIRSLQDLMSALSNTKKHPFLPEAELPKFLSHAKEVVAHLETQKAALHNRLTNDEILDYVQETFEGRTGQPFTDAELTALAAEGATRYQNQVPPGYKDGKKDTSTDPYKKYGDLIVWKQLIAQAKAEEKPVVFITDDQKEDWWLEQSGRKIGPRIELREEFLSEVQAGFWMYTVDKFVEMSARRSNTKVSSDAIAEIIEVRQHDWEYNDSFEAFMSIPREELLERLAGVEYSAEAEGGRIVGVNAFVDGHLKNVGYDPDYSYHVLEQLEVEGLVEIYEHDMDGKEPPIRAVRLVRHPRQVGRPHRAVGALVN
ncbi:PIN domain-containing protein [Paucibacter sp. R3-3]|uniref:PIN domain-containing protein n=1 Tax=Roseateles agri TaxID=3098619 RepID=A0ABU5DES5_9BURK|nr:PIN domain-containing protein [Paucibacter sp. R3-3]MDY0744775.1 PIN domain-containing protein [Paucibacter sp. R3-3]